MSYGFMLGEQDKKIERLEAELAEWQRHGVKITEGADDWDECVWGWHPHPGSCFKLRVGVSHTVSGFSGRELIAFPAEWLEAE